MPTIARIFGFRVVIYFNDRRPAHVHVIRNACEAVFSLHRGPAAMRLSENYGFKRKEVATIKKALTKILPALWAAWTDIHGPR